MLLRHWLTTGLTLAAEKSPSCKTLCTRFRILPASLFGQALSKSPRARVPSQNLPPAPTARTGLTFLLFDFRSLSGTRARQHDLVKPFEKRSRSIHAKE